MVVPPRPLFAPPALDLRRTGKRRARAAMLPATPFWKPDGETHRDQHRSASLAEATNEAKSYCKSKTHNSRTIYAFMSFLTFTNPTLHNFTTETSDKGKIPKRVPFLLYGTYARRPKSRTKMAISDARCARTLVRTHYRSL